MMHVLELSGHKEEALVSSVSHECISCPGLGSVPTDARHWITFPLRMCCFYQYSHADCHRTQSLNSTLKNRSVKCWIQMFRLTLNLAVVVWLDRRANVPTPLLELPLLIRMVIFSLRDRHWPHHHHKLYYKMFVFVFNIFYYLFSFLVCD